MALDLPSLASGALGFTVALAWNNAISLFVTRHIPRHDPHAAVKIAVTTAVVITLIIVLAVGAYTRWHSAGSTALEGDAVVQLIGPARLGSTRAGALRAAGFAAA